MLARFSTLTDFSAYLLVYHGSNDPRPGQAVQQLADFFAERIQHQGNGARPVGVVALECQPFALHEQIQQFCQRHNLEQSKSSEPVCTIALLPLFLLRGVHVMEDIPTQVMVAQQALQPEIKLHLCSPLGFHMGLQRLIQEQMAGQPMEAWILLAHGSRRVGANQSIEVLADRLGAIAAFWAVPPNLETRLQELADLGIRRVGIFPYFLFAGGITDAIGQQVATLATQFPTLTLTLVAPLTAGPDVADFLVELAQVQSQA